MYIARECLDKNWRENLWNDSEPAHMDQKLLFEQALATCRPGLAEISKETAETFIADSVYETTRACFIDLLVKLISVP